MGILIYSKDAQFFIASQDKEAAFIAGRNTPERYNWWVYFDDIEQANNLEELMYAWQYPVVNDSDGNIIDIQFEGEKAGMEFEFFKRIAPYVRDGSYIEMYAETGDIWRWVFKDGECRAVVPIVLWPF